MKTLFEETRIGVMQLRNRLVRSATLEAIADDNGRPTPRLISLYHDLAAGGTGLIITSATTITSDARRLSGMLAIPRDAWIPAYQELTRAVHTAGSPIVMQLSFTGRNGALWAPDHPSQDEIRSIVKAFGDAAHRAQLAGFDGVEIHAAHGYFLSQFLNKKRNTRKDEYGGTLRNRIRFLLEIEREIRARTGEAFAILVKINCSDFEDDDGVWDACQNACTQLAEQGIDAIELSSGLSRTPFPPPGLPYDESIFRDYAAEIARIVKVPVILVGLNRTPSVMIGLLNTTGIGYFSLSRPFLRQPDLANYWRTNPDTPAKCRSCDSCRKQQDGTVCPFREYPAGQEW
jgi:2,4-dienoyl-CoA reductase-like NADH-dependent reductase (Old Yellow Enzyme family)